MKRVVDVTVAAMGLFLLAPLMGAIALAIKLGDGGSIFFSQTRVGQFGLPFRMHKFRTMIQYAEQVGVPLTIGNDARITKVGYWLRRTKLDELPQLWNVVKGEMSLVGPRPEVPRYVALYTPEQRQVLEVRPGITDLASLRFMDEASCLAQMPNPEAAYLTVVLPHKLTINLEYMRQRTTFSDVAIVLATLWRLVTPAPPTIVPKAEKEMDSQAA